MAEAANKKKKSSHKTALSWEELLVEKVLAKIMEKDRQINESVDRFEQQMKERNRQINESADRFEQQMRERNRQINESAGRFERQIKENAELTDRQMREGFELTDREMRKTDSWVDRLNKYSETLKTYIDLPNLMQKFNEMGFVFERSYKDATIKDKKHNIFIEVDITLESNDKVMIIEFMNKPTAGDIAGHIKRMREMRRYGDLHGEKRKYIGAISGADFNDNEKLLAMKNGFYVIEPSGETFVINAPEGGYLPKEW